LLGKRLPMMQLFEQRAGIRHGAVEYTRDRRHTRRATGAADGHRQSP
jgi:hypothetical protein